MQQWAPQSCGWLRHMAGPSASHARPETVSLGNPGLSLCCMPNQHRSVRTQSISIRALDGTVRRWDRASARAPKGQA
jgi:hypothetical protein